MYEPPARRRAVTRADVDNAKFRADLIEAIDSDPDVRQAILRLLAAARTARKPRPTITPPVRQAGRGR